MRLCARMHNGSTYEDIRGKSVELVHVAFLFVKGGVSHWSGAHQVS